MIVGGYRRFLEFYLVIKGLFNTFYEKGAIFNLFRLKEARYNLIHLLLPLPEQKTLNNTGDYSG